MDKNNSLDTMNTLPESIGNLVDKTIGNVLIQEVGHYKELTTKLEEQFDSYLNKSADFLENNTVSGYLFESYNASINIKNIIEEYIQDSNGKLLEEALNKFNVEVFNTLNIRFDEGDSEKAEFKIKTSGIQKILRKSLDSILKKKPPVRNISKYYLYFILVRDVLETNIDKIEFFEKGRLDLLINLRNKSEIIENNATILTQNNYDISTSRKEFKQSISFEDTKKLIEEYAIQVSGFIKTIKESIETAYKSYENEKNTHNDNIDKNWKKYGPDQVLRSSKKIEKEFLKARSKWYNTVLALRDDWTLDLEINSLKFHILKSYFSFIKYIEQKLKTPLDEKINSMRDYTEELKTIFKTTEGLLPEDTINTIQKSKLDFRRKLVLRLVPEIKTILLNSDLPKEVDEFEKNCAKQFEALSKSRLLIKNPLYNQPTDQSELQKISPHDLVSFDMQPDFMEVFPSLKNALIRQMQVLQNKLDEIPEVIDFSIESAIGYYEDNKDLTEALKIGSEGIKRATNKIEDLTTLRSDFYATEVDLMKDKIDRLFKEISEITDNENAIQIKIRITKAKAVEQSKAVRDKIIQNIKHVLPHVLSKINRFNTFLIESSIKIRKQFEGDVTKGFITSDVSDYLAETEEAVKRLPFVYQRLFKLEPLTSFDLYIERQEAHEKFKLAYERWKSGKFAPAIISGEKGSGKTSFINLFLTSKSINEKIIYHDLHKEYLEPEEAYNKLYHSINDLLNNQNENDLNKPIRIVVIDGLEKLFEARIDGFNVLQKTVQLISKTNNQIFWIVACHLYSYKYLEKSFNISDYFGYHIELQDLSAEELITIIEKRHNISGFRLDFLPDTQKKSMITIKKQSDKNDQSELRTVYFDRLQKIVSGNITQAFLYWMRSAAEVTEDIIYINAPGDTNLDFIRSISLSKFEILKNILIHNGISSGKHSEIFRIPFEKSELQLEQMLDDGIIIKRSEFYNINPMIYKQVIDQMYKLNLLH